MSMYDDLLASVQRRVKRAQDGDTNASSDEDNEGDSSEDEGGVGVTMQQIKQRHWAKGLYRRFHKAKNKDLTLEEEMAKAKKTDGPSTNTAQKGFTEETQ